MHPNVLYHYTTVRGFIGIVSSHELWASSIRHMNDVREFRYARDVVAETLVKQARYADNRSIRPWARKFAERLQHLDRLYAGREGQNFVVSFSSVGDQLSQWRAYSPLGGHALGFSVEALEEVGKASGCELLQCEYDRREHESVAVKVVERTIRELAALPDTVLDNHDIDEVTGLDQVHETIYPIEKRLLDEILRVAPKWKDPAFQEESEWRLVTKKKHRELFYREGRRSIIPYVKVRIDLAELMKDGRHTAIDQNIVGPCAEPQLSLETASLMLSQHKFRNVRMHLSRVPYREW